MMKAPWLPAMILGLALCSCFSPRTSIPQGKPYVAFLATSDTVYWYNLAPFTIRVIAGPEGADVSAEGMSIARSPEREGEYIATLDTPPIGITVLSVSATIGGVEARDTIYLSVETPMLEWHRYGDAWDADWQDMHAIVGEGFNFPARWQSTHILPAHYHTTISFGDRVVWDRDGLISRRQAREDTLLEIPEIEAADIHADIYWKPGGTNDRARWVKLLSSQNDRDAVIRLPHPITLAYPKPIIAMENRSYVYIIRPYTLLVSPESIICQRIGRNEYYGVSLHATCPECNRYGLHFTIDSINERDWGFTICRCSIDTLLAHAEEVQGKRFPVYLEATGRGGATSRDTLWVIIAINFEAFDHPGSAYYSTFSDIGCTGSECPRTHPVQAPRPIFHSDF